MDQTTIALLCLHTRLDQIFAVLQQLVSATAQPNPSPGTSARLTDLRSRKWPRVHRRRHLSPSSTTAEPSSSPRESITPPQSDRSTSVQIWSAAPPTSYLPSTSGLSNASEASKPTLSATKTPWTSFPIVRRTRVRKSTEQLKLLNQAYIRNDRPTTTEVKDISERTGLTTSNIRTWFCWKRFSAKNKQQQVNGKSESH